MPNINYKAAEVQADRERRAASDTRVKTEDPYPFSEKNIIDELHREAEQEEKEAFSIQSTDEWLEEICTRPSKERV